ncbi:methylmalonate-semialdehyde dehydrogenase [Colletotrichum plurivorum]|uniref:Methylmalonate-semialdehyde dehydrogenase n=1 Tax=Colletotrichum plurivorum TaxID=2175906 RepID=A0A8H6KUB3_9PEZI|nr:methylmalonate-semialdehyde dehydrogenase [Colletotrichum plurivorum]
MQPWRITSASAARSVRRRAVVPEATSCIHSSTSSHDVLRRPRIHVKKKPEEPAVPPSWKPFEIPNVLLDLDSWGNEYTRPYDADEAKAQRQKWAADPRHDAIRKRVVRFSRILAKLDESFDRVNEDAVWQHWRLMDQDIMVAALQNPGVPRPRESHDYSSFQRHVFYNNAVPESTYRDDKRLIGWLLHRRLTTRHDRFHPDRLASAIDASKSTSDLHRLISSLLDSNQRIPMKPFHANKIAAALSRLSTDPDHVKLLPVLNSFFLYCKQSGYTFTPALCDICMAISARALRLGALEMYLQHGVNNKYWDDSKPTEIEGMRLTLSTLEWHLGNFQTKSIDGGQVRDRPSSARHINDLANYANPRDVLSRLCALFKKIVESNPTDSALKTQHEKVVDMVKSLPAGASRAGGIESNLQVET